ncbi:DNA-binding transcriptional regulator, CsgD family [Rhodopseudomonas pseudopalustris]|uniref:DNA-binding transcriptional regulator, CsgD family n=2 Tax=Rhodopseudomonas pseudopalustris TaxID=1513892 RepID=A0A1H8VJE2_9BRAD|nr:DNA-binding transcriptional regulator, CsgD family [Rhodopseudomonas pseudopalustris]
MLKKRSDARQPAPCNPDEWMTAVDAGTRVLAGALDSLSIHTIVLDGSGRCSQVSPYAETLLADSTVLTIRQNRLRRSQSSRAVADCRCAGGPIEIDQDLQPCIDCVTRSASARDLGSSACSISVSGDRGLVLHLRLSSIPSNADETSFAAAAILVIESQTLTNSAELLPDVAVLLTAAEREVATELLSGRRPAEIALRRSVSIGTIRSQIKRIYAKLEVSGFVEFIARARR